MPAGQPRWLFSLILLLFAGFSTHEFTHKPVFHLLFFGGATDKTLPTNITTNFTQHPPATHTLFRAKRTPAIPLYGK
uniref:Putative secreted protein n=1 Tax=Anopheles darlingi TaxID=43151 RepID=A0A2M4DNV0_ANODA